MRLAIFGGTGGTGRLLVREALARGHDVAALARSDDHGLPTAVRVVVGDARDAAAVRPVVAGADAVVSVMAIEAGTEPTAMLSDATRTVADAMTELGVRRLVLTANSTVFTDREIADPFRIVAEEHRRNLAVLRATDLDWTVLAPTLLRDGDAGSTLEAVVDAKADGRQVSRAALAGAVLDALGRDDWIGHVVGIADDQPADGPREGPDRPS